MRATQQVQGRCQTRGLLHYYKEAQGQNSMNIATHHNTHDNNTYPAYTKHTTHKHTTHAVHA